MNSNFRFPRRPLVLALSLALAVGEATAETIIVNDGSDNPSSQDCTLRHALQAAAAGSPVAACLAGSGADTIVFAPALHDSTITLTQGELEIESAVSIQGSGQVLAGDGAHRVLDVLLYGSSFGLSNLTLTNGNAGAYGGGGIYVNTAIVAAPRGTIPAISATLDHVTVSNNSAGMGGGGVAASAPVDLTLIYSTVSGNQVTTVSSGAAGGVFAPYGSWFRITDSTISGNTAIGGNGLAGGVYSLAGLTTLTNSTVTGNVALGSSTAAGGLLLAGAANTLWLMNSTVTRNTATIGLVLAGSHAPEGGSVYVAPGAGGILAGVGGSNTLVLENTILSANTFYGGLNLLEPAFDPGAAYADLQLMPGTSIAILDCLLGSALSLWSGNGNVFSDTPGLSPLDSNGGPTRTMALLDGSPALNAGDPALAHEYFLDGFYYVALRFDQRGPGFPRLLDGKVDIGAFQHQDDRIFADGMEGGP